MVRPAIGASRGKAIPRLFVERKRQDVEIAAVGRRTKAGKARYQSSRRLGRQRFLVVPHHASEEQWHLAIFALVRCTRTCTAFGMVPFGVDSKGSLGFCGLAI